MKERSFSQESGSEIITAASDAELTLDHRLFSEEGREEMKEEVSDTFNGNYGGDIVKNIGYNIAQNKASGYQKGLLDYEQEVYNTSREGGLSSHESGDLALSLGDTMTTYLDNGMATSNVATPDGMLLGCRLGPAGCAAGAVFDVAEIGILAGIEYKTYLKLKGSYDSEKKASESATEIIPISTPAPGMPDPKDPKDDKDKKEKARELLEHELANNVTDLANSSNGNKGPDGDYSEIRDIKKGLDVNTERSPNFRKYQDEWSNDKSVIGTNVRGDEEFVRVYRDTSSNPLLEVKDNKSGNWIMQRSEIEGLNAREIQKKYALPEVPTHMVDVEPTVGTHVNVGEASGNEYGDGGGRQWYLDVEERDLKKKWFKNSKEIK